MDEKHKTLYEKCFDAGYDCAKLTFNTLFTSWREEINIHVSISSISDEESIFKIIKQYGLLLGFPSADDVSISFSDQSSEFLYGGNQADIIEIDSTMFPEFNGYNHWSVLDKYFGEKSVEIVEEAFQEGLNKFLDNFYKESKTENWPDD